MLKIFFDSPSDFQLRDLRGILCIVGILALATSFSYFVHFREFSAPDSPGYITPAGNLVAGRGFSDAAGGPETLRTPGYPLLIALFLGAGLNLKYLVLCQHFMRILLALTAVTFAYQISKSRKAALVAGVLYCVDLPTLLAANSLLTEMFFTTILTIIFWLLWSESRNQHEHWTRTVVIGLLCGASALVRPIAIFFFLPAMIYLWLVRKRFRLRASLVFVMSFACLPLLWMTRNYNQTGYFIFSSISGADLLSYRAAGALAVNDPGPFAANFRRHRDELEALACEDLIRLYGRECSTLPIPMSHEYYGQLGRKILLQHPAAAAKLTLRGIAVTMLDGGAPSFAEIAHISPHTAIKVLLLYTVPVLCLAIAGLWWIWSENRQFFYLAVLIMFYFVFLSAGAESYSRYRVPIIPILVVLTAIGLDFILGRLHPHRAEPGPGEMPVTITKG